MSEARLGESHAGGGVRPRQFAGDGDEVRQLHRALHRGMARQDLLEQRRAGARHAEDEDGVWRVGPVSTPLLEELSGEDLTAAAYAR